MATDVSSVVSHFPDAENGFSTTTSGSVSSGAATVGLNSVAGYTNGQPAVFVIDPSDVTKKQTFTGIVDTGGVQITSVVWTAGSNTSHASGATVVDYATATHIAMISKGLQVAHNQSGTLKTNVAITTNAASLTSPKITTDISDSSGNELIKVTATGSAVNEITLANAATGTNPTITSSGGDTDIGLNIVPKGAGQIQVNSKRASRFVPLIPAVSLADIDPANASWVSVSVTGNTSATTFAVLIQMGLSSSTTAGRLGYLRQTGSAAAQDNLTVCTSNPNATGTKAWASTIVATDTSQSFDYSVSNADVNAQTVILRGYYEYFN